MAHLRVGPEVHRNATRTQSCAQRFTVTRADNGVVRSNEQQRWWISGPGPRDGLRVLGPGPPTERGTAGVDIERSKVIGTSHSYEASDRPPIVLQPTIVYR